MEYFIGRLLDGIFLLRPVCFYQWQYRNDFV